MITLLDMSGVLCILLYLIGPFVTVLHGEIFTSVYKLSILAQEEGKLLKAFTKYIVDKGKDGEQISYELQR